jgi:hypothetical protein
MKNVYQRWIMIVAVMFFVPTCYLIYLNLQNPGFCPPYPLIGLPACVVIAVYFAMILVSLIIKDERVSSYVFFIPALLGLGSGILFSTKQIIGLSYCPTLFEIPLPLCFTAVPAFAVLLYLKYREKKILLLDNKI